MVIKCYQYCLPTISSSIFVHIYYYDKHSTRNEDRGLYKTVFHTGWNKTNQSSNRSKVNIRPLGSARKVVRAASAIQIQFDFALSLNSADSIRSLLICLLIYNPRSLRNHLMSFLKTRMFPTGFDPTIRNIIESALLFMKNLI